MHASRPANQGLDIYPHLPFAQGPLQHRGGALGAHYRQSLEQRLGDMAEMARSQQHQGTALALLQLAGQKPCERSCCALRAQVKLLVTVGRPVKLQCLWPVLGRPRGTRH